MRRVIVSQAFAAQYQDILVTLFDWYSETMWPADVRDGFRTAFLKTLDSFRVLSPGKGRTCKRFWFTFKGNNFTVQYTYKGEAMALLGISFSSGRRAASWVVGD